MRNTNTRQPAAKRLAYLPCGPPRKRGTETTVLIQIQIFNQHDITKPVTTRCYLFRFSDGVLPGAVILIH
jgi:hypothetical protein